MRGIPGLLLAGLMAGQAAGQDLPELVGDRHVLRLDGTSGLPLHWIACDRPCAEPGARRQQLLGAGAGVMAWRDAAPDPGGPFTATVAETGDGITAELRAPAANLRYELSRSRPVLRLTVEVPAGAGLRLTSGPGLIPPPLPGFGAAFTRVRAMHITRTGAFRLEAGPLPVAAGDWSGFRSRFWALLVRPDWTAEWQVSSQGRDLHALDWDLPAGPSTLELYGGPVAWQELRAVDAPLTGLLFDGLWRPLRWLSLGLMFLLGAIATWVPGPGLAIILLSLAVKVLLAPLTAVADRWQRQVNVAQSRLEPRLAAIRRAHRGEEAHNLTLAAYREAGVHPLYTLKSLAGFAIQVPVFIAAYHMLADNFALAGTEFLWIKDLTAPDRLAPLPVSLPFFGGDLNLLPLLMTALTIVSALVQRDLSLSPGLLRRQQRNLLWLAGAFLLLFYTFPAGMVLYWTANNFWHLARVLTLDRYRAAAGS